MPLNRRTLNLRFYGKTFQTKATASKKNRSSRENLEKTLCELRDLSTGEATAALN